MSRSASATKMRPMFLSLSVAAIFMAALCATDRTAQAAFTLPTPNCGLGPNDNCLVFNQFTVYSLAALNAQAGFGALGSGDPYYVQSNGSNIASDLVIASGDANAIDNHDVGITTGVDNAYYTPNNISGGGNTNYLMTGQDGQDGQQATTGSPSTRNPDPGIGFTGDNVQQPNTLINNPNAPDVAFSNGTALKAQGSLPLWDVSVAGLKSYLGSGDLVFFFNLNEENGATLDGGQDMYVYANVYLTNLGADHAVGGTGANADTSIEFTLSGNNTTPAPPGVLDAAQTAGVDDILPTASDDWAHVHGQLCMNTTTGAVLGFGDCASNGNPAGGTTINQNLGSSNAAFAIYSAALNNDVKTGAWDIMSVDLRMGHIGGGFEQLFIMAGTAIPEPGTFAMFGGVVLLLLGLGRKLGKAASPAV